MKLGLLADIHEHNDHLRAALDCFREQHVDQVVVLGDVFEMGKYLEDSCRLLLDAGAVGVWGNHEFGLSCDADPRALEQYSGTTVDFMRTLQPRLEIDGCLFTHVEPWLDPTVLTDIWHMDDFPDTPEKAARSFDALPHRIMITGHLHRWLIATPEAILGWPGDEPMAFQEGERYLVVVAAICDGRYAVFDTEAMELTPFNERPLPPPYG